MANTDDCGRQDAKRGAKSERDTKGVNKKVECPFCLCAVCRTFFSEKGSRVT